MIKDEAPAGEFEVGQQVSLVIKSMTDLGFKAVVDDKYWGVLYYDEVFQELEKNQAIVGYIKNIRPDGRLDLTLYKTGNAQAKDLGQTILDDLKASGGYLPLDSKTVPQYIYDRYGVSKKKFKMALGGLYKKRLIEIKEDGIYLIQGSALKS